jgi:hypothetical protein
MMFEIESEIDTSDVVYGVARAHEMTRDNYAGLLEFIMDIDAEVCDLQFTKALRNQLSEVIEQEERG